MLLNFDVLIATAFYLDKNSLIRFMRTCKTLYTSCIPDLLRRPHSLYDDTIASFCHFVLADHTRLERLQTLQFDDQYPTFTWEKTDARKIAEVLTGARHLHTLRIINCARFFRRDDDVSKAIATMKNLRRITLRIPDQTTFNLLKQLQSPVTSIDIGNLDSNPSRLDISSFRQFRSTLESFKSSTFLMVDVGAVYPCLHTLHFDSEGVDLSRIINAFPQLRNLSLSKLIPLHPRSLLLLRARNRGTLKDKSWTELSLVEGNIPIVHSLGLTCTVRHIVGHIYNTSDYWLLDEVIQDVRPEALTVFLCVPSNVTAVKNLIPPVAPTLKQLNLNLTFLPDSVYYDDVMLRLMRQMRNHTLTSVSFNFCYGRDDVHHDRIALLASLKGKRMVEELFKVVRTLKNVSAGFPCKERREYQRSYWLAATERGERPKLERVVHYPSWTAATSDSPFDAL